MKCLFAAWWLSVLMIPGAVTADTVMLYLEEDQDSRYFELSGIEYASAVEDGVMDVFFDAGHIIFNFGLASSIPEPPFKADRPSIRAAKSGGATYLIEISLSNPAPDRRVPAVVKFAYYDVRSGEALVSGDLVVGDIDDGSIADERALCIALGREVALRALSGS